MMPDSFHIFHETDGSSAIESVGYDGATRVMQVQFRSSGRVYAYDGVPAFVVQSLLSAESVGRHFGKFVRDRFPSRRVA